MSVFSFLDQGAPMLDGQFRSSVDKGTKPIGAELRRTGLSPDHLTIGGLVFSVAAAVAIGAGFLPLGLLFVVLTGLCDLFDGAVARASGGGTPRGAFFDSVSDRFSDAVLFGGVAWYFASTQPGLLALLPMAVYGTASIISYERAKAESLGYEAKGGIMERAERIILLGLGLLFPVLLVPVLVLMLVLTSVTAVQRFFKVWGQASNRPARANRRRTPRRRTRTTTRTAGNQSWRQRVEGRRRPPA